ncbi:MAG TPA: DUF3500 domain-containing protein, partial [Anaerolineae bacterium]|nr:DUF3500 domain-containing protein [Anaerolineae bacterium]
MNSKKQAKPPMTRRHFIRLGATATAGLLLAACTSDPPVEKAAPVEALAQSQPTSTPNPPTATPVPTNTAAPQPTTAANMPASQPTPTATHTPAATQEQMLIADMTQAATDFFESLDAGQHAKAVYAFNSEERFRWHWTTPRNFPRNGLPLREMSEDQKARAYDLLQASISSMGFEKALNIMSLQNDLGNDPELYYVTLFGTPGTPEPWGWRWEGHHLSRQFTVVSEQVAMMPFFLGSWPTTTEAGLRAMASEEDAALELINSFTGSAREAAIFQEAPLTSHVTQNAAQVTPLEPVGVSYTDMTGAQQGLVTQIMQAYLGTLPDHMAAASTERINKAGL